MIPHPELSRRIQVRSLGSIRAEAAAPDAGLDMLVEASPAECEAVARRLDVPAVASIRCRFRLGPADASGQVDANGLLQAELTRICVTTLEAFPASVVEAFGIRFVPGHHAADPVARPGREPGFEAPWGQDNALDLEADDEIPYEGGLIDLGEATVEQLALALDPYPHKPGAELPAGVGQGDPPAAADPDSSRDAAPPGEDEAEARPNPFAALARLRRGDA